MRAAPGVDLGNIIGRTRDLLLDFDGPICSIFAGLPAPVVAARLRELLGSDGQPLPDAVAADDDPIEVFRFTSGLDADTAARVEAALRDAERTATATAAPTSGAREVLLGCQQTGRRVAIISNNSQTAVETYLQAQGLAAHVDVIVGRTDPDPHLLKPHPHLVLRALDALGGDPARSSFVGDSTSDVLSAKAAGTHSVGYANKPGKVERLRGAGADVIVTSMAELHAALVAHQPPSS
jgi:HAD superfamily hydrolase (TIGR01509 family)